jgi:hypothetical protein
MTAKKKDLLDIYTDYLWNEVRKYKEYYRKMPDTIIIPHEGRNFWYLLSEDINKKRPHEFPALDGRIFGMQMIYDDLIPLKNHAFITNGPQIQRQMIGPSQYPEERFSVCGVSIHWEKV